MGPPRERSIRRPIAPRANALTTELHLAPAHSEQAVVAHACLGHRYRPSPVPLTGTGKKKGGGGGTREYEQSDWNR